MSVRYANIEDMKYVAKIKIDGWRTAYKDIIEQEYLDELDYEKNKSRLEENFIENSCCVYENDKKEVIGFCRFGDRQNIDEEGYKEYDSELCAIYVSPDSKGHGIGRKLFDFAVMELRKRGKTRMLLWVLEENEPSILFYKKMGGTLLGKKKQKIGDKSYLEISFGYKL